MFKEVWDRRLATGSEILCIAVDPLYEGATRIAIGTRTKLIQLYNYDSRGRMTCIFSLQANKIVPVGIDFPSSVNDITVYSLFDGKM